MLEDLTSLVTPIDGIDAAADLLRRMLAELQDLEMHCSRLHFAMSTKRQDLRRQLDLLCGIAGLLKSGEAPWRARELGERANRLILDLATELEHLSLQTEHDLRTDHLASLPHYRTM